MAETLIPLEEREEERRPSRVEPPRRSGGWVGKLALVLAVFAATLASPVPAIATMMVWGVLVFALVSPLQMRVVDQARDAPNLASTVNQGTFNLGNAAGAWIGGQALLHGMGYSQLPWLGAGLAVLALLLALLRLTIVLTVAALLALAGLLVPAGSTRSLVAFLTLAAVTISVFVAATVTVVRAAPGAVAATR